MLAPAEKGDINAPGLTGAVRLPRGRGACHKNTENMRHLLQDAVLLSQGFAIMIGKSHRRTAEGGDVLSGGNYMRVYGLLFVSLILQACSLPQATSQSPRMDVDVADSLNIADFHKRKEDARPLAAMPLETKPQEAKPQESEEADIVARDAYQPSTGPGKAYATIHQALYRACPAGWIKQREWAQPDDGLFYLYISARCR